MGRKPSLRRHLLLWLAPSLIALLAVNAVLTYRTAVHNANIAYDHLLAGAARAISDGTHIAAGNIVIDVPYVAFELFESGAHDRVFYRVADRNGRTITGYEDLPQPAAVPPPYQPVYYDAAYQGEPVRVIAAAKPLYEPSVPGPVLIQVAQTLDSRSLLTRAILQDAVVSQTLLVALAVAVVWFGIQRALRPLRALRADLHARSSDDLTPVDPSPAPREVRPLIRAMNEHIERHARLAESQRQFLADASHQLRTPLAIIKTQAEFGLRQAAGSEKDEALAAIIAQTGTATRTANQLLLLARVSPSETGSPPFESFDLAALAERTTVDFIALARAREIDLGYDGPASGITLSGNAHWLREALANLIDNALRYTPSGGHVTVHIGREHDRVRLDVVDSGPGIPGSERERVFKRFYRVAGTPGEGSGLGLAIVREICTRHQGEITLGDADQRGLRVTMSLPP